ncbi:hypothetical protein Q0N71_31525 [Bacillus thuringiensis]|uniref:hypothetical protein n=1 Tax=Bacillus thuringiensis TaxID=1428 RepID=UPI003458E832
MLFKKKLIKASLLSLGILARGTFVRNTSALAAPYTEQEQIINFQNCYNDVVSTIKKRYENSIQSFDYWLDLQHQEKGKFCKFLSALRVSSVSIREKFIKELENEFNRLTNEINSMSKKTRYKSEEGEKLICLANIFHNINRDKYINADQSLNFIYLEWPPRALRGSWISGEV